MTGSLGEYYEIFLAGLEYTYFNHIPKSILFYSIAEKANLPVQA